MFASCIAKPRRGDINLCRPSGACLSNGAPVPTTVVVGYRYAAPDGAIALCHSLLISNSDYLLRLNAQGIATDFNLVVDGNIRAFFSGQFAPGDER